MDRRRLAEVRAGTAEQSKRGGSGYLVGEHLVLTARHVLADDDDRMWPRVEVWLGHPGDGPRRRAKVALAWQDPVRDVVLLRVEGEPFTDAPAVRWGWFAGSSPAEYDGLGFPQFADYESGRGVEQLHGVVLPHAAGSAKGYVLDQLAAPDREAGRVWVGVSGTAVFCEGLLVGVVAEDDRSFGNRRIHAIPAHVLLADREFAGLVAQDTGMPPVPEAVELKEFLEPPVGVARTPGSLLAAAVEVVKFTGREAVMGDLAGWLDGAARFAVTLVTGEGGQGKTRLAREFAARSRQSGWIAGFAAGVSADDGGYVGNARELARRLRTSARPVLVIADYAETRSGYIAALADDLTNDPPGVSVRLLLLSRTAGSWWNNLTEALAGQILQPVALPPLTSNDQARRDAYGAAVTSLASRLLALPESPVDGKPAWPWAVLAQRLSDHPRGLDDARYSNALTLQMTALTDLLTVASGHEPLRLGKSEERELVRHESSYLRRAAEKRGLFASGVLSDWADADDRKHDAWTALERALAGIILFGPCDRGRAEAIGSLASASRSSDVVRWLADLYPPPDDLRTIGTVQPDRLAELLLGGILTRQPGLLTQAADLANDTRDALEALFTLVRTASHPEFGSVGAQARDLIVTNADPFAKAAPYWAATIPQAAPLRDGLLRLGQQRPQAFREHAYAAVDQLPRASISLVFFSAALTRGLTGIVRDLARENADVYLPDLAMLLTNLFVRIKGIGQREEALALAREAADIYRVLAEASPVAHLPDLAMSLNNLATGLSEAWQRQEALAPAQESVTIRRGLAEASPKAYLPGLASSLHNLANRLGESGQPEAALAPLQEAVTIRRGLAEASPDAHLPDLAMSLTNLSSWLGKAGQREAALAPARRRLAFTGRWQRRPRTRISRTWRSR